MLVLCRLPAAISQSLGDQPVLGRRLPHALGHEFVCRVANPALAGFDPVPELAPVGLVVVSPKASGVFLAAAAFYSGEQVPAQRALGLAHSDLSHESSTQS
jgi:hypothetical protein